MKLISRNVALEYFGAPAPAELENWCKENGFGGVFPTRDSGEDMPSDVVLAAALWHTEAKYPNSEKMDKCSYAGLVAYLATGWYGGFGTEIHKKERQAENVILSLAGGIAPEPGGVFAFAPAEIANRQGQASAEFTEKVLALLDGFYFGDAEEAVTLAIQDVDPVIAARAILALARNQAEYENLVRIADGFLKKKTSISSLRKAVRDVLGTAPII